MNFFLKNIPKEYREFLTKLVIFLALFIVVSGIIGPPVIATKLLFKFYFFIYGNLGKMVLFSAITFILLTRDRLAKMRSFGWKKTNAIFILAGFLLLAPFYAAAQQLLRFNTFWDNVPLSLTAHAITILSPLLILVGVFGVEFCIYFVKQFKKEILICLAISIIFDIAIFQVWRLWPYLSAIVLHSVYGLFKLSFPVVYTFPPRTLLVQNFAVSIEESCSGIDSIFLFSTLYIMIAFLDWKVLNHKKLLLLFLPALIGLFFVNILRVYLLVLIGVVISPILALKLFHTYAGMLLFIIYFIVFWKLLYDWMKK